VLLVVLFVLLVFDVVEPLSVLEPLALELWDEPLDPEPELELELPVPEFVEPPVVELLEPEPELLPVLELSLVLEPELLLELELPEFEDSPEPLVDESVVLLVVSELESLFSVDSDVVGFSDWVVSWGFSASVWVAWVSSVVVSCVRPGVVPMPLPWVSALTRRAEMRTAATPAITDATTRRFLVSRRWLSCTARRRLAGAMRVPEGANLTSVSSAGEAAALWVAVAAGAAATVLSASTGWGMSFVCPAAEAPAGLSASGSLSSGPTAPLIASADFENRLLSTEDDTVAAAAPTMAPMSEPATPICDESENDTPAASALASICANERSPNTPPARSSCSSLSPS